MNALSKVGYMRNTAYILPYLKDIRNADMSELYDIAPNIRRMRRYK